ncbi:MAG: hypothetical protein V2I25_07690 [Woeseiaceae bacterium]|nr:hypothetical protein [Woeseiaceae bacterium]
MSEPKAFPEAGVYRLVAEHPALLVSLGYVFASAIGMLFSWSYLWHFGIDFFEYAQIGDFLLASLKEPMTWGVVVAAMLVVAMDNLLSLRWARKERSRWTRWYGSDRYRKMNYLTGILLVVVFIWIYAHEKAEATRSGALPTVDIVLAERGTRLERVILGTTANYIFTLDPVGGNVGVFPVEALEMIRYELPD